jgi:SAM-dependent methyltransferase
MSVANTSAEFFEEKYRCSEDPWNFASSIYENDRYNSIIRAVAVRRGFSCGFEPGCSIGVLTSRLAPYCDRLEATDISPTAVHHARTRCRGLENVRITCSSVLEPPGSGPFDLVIFSELGYYFDRETLRRLVNTLTKHLLPSGLFIACHWLGSSADHELAGGLVHDVINGSPKLDLQYSEAHREFRLDRWKRI